MKSWFRDVFKAEQKDSFADGNNAFAFRLYAQLRRGTGNLFFSPFGIGTALATTYAGARGETAAEVRNALHFPAAYEELHAALGDIVRRLRNVVRDEYEMSVANSLWVQKGTPIESTFIDLAASLHGDCIKSTDFRHAAEAARASINHWVEDTTNRRIRDLISADVLNPVTSLVIVNAVYFKAQWLHRFDAAFTRKESFYLDDGGEVRAQLMLRCEDFWYSETDDFQAVDLPYRHGELSMLILLPTQKNGLRRVEEKLSMQMLNATVNRMTSRNVRVDLPRFMMTSPTIGMRAHLEMLGVRLLFDSMRADLSGINGRLPPDPDALAVSDVLHKAFVDVHETGTEAAAATAVVVPMASLKPTPKPRPVIFRADHPFVFAIRDRQSGAILFLGRLMDPTRS